MQGRCLAPPSKSHTLRAILFGAMGAGTTRITRPLLSPDSEAMIRASRAFGALISTEEGALVIEGVAGRPRTPHDVIDCGNSGQVLRFVGALAALCDGYTILTGDASIRSRRPAQPLLDGLNQLGAFAQSSRGSGHAPLIIGPGVGPGCAEIEGDDSQPVSGLLMLMAMLDGESRLSVRDPGERPWMDLTLYWLRKLGYEISHRDHEQFAVLGGSHKGFSMAIPGDFSSALYPVCAALITGSEIAVGGLDPKDPQGDKAVIEVLRQMGARISFEDDLIARTGDLVGAEVDINPFIDAVTILAVVACCAATPTRLYNGSIARKKECDRIACIARELTKMGARIEERPDGLIIEPSHLRGAHLQCYDDHRMAMALYVASLVADGESLIEGTECVAKSYPNFFGEMEALIAC